MDLRFKMTEKEFIRSIRQTMNKQPLTQTLIPATILFAGLAVWTGLMPARIAPLWMLLAAGGAFYLFYLYMVAPGRAYDRLDPALRDVELHYRFTSTGVELKSESFQARWDWKLFGHYSEEKDSFAIYPTSPGNYILVPKRSLPSQQALKDFRDLLKSHLRLW